MVIFPRPVFVYHREKDEKNPHWISWNHPLLSPSQITMKPLNPLFRPKSTSFSSRFESLRPAAVMGIQPLHEHRHLHLGLTLVLSSPERAFQGGTPKCWVYKGKSHENMEIPMKLGKITQNIWNIPWTSQENPMNMDDLWWKIPNGWFLLGNIPS